jgi:hypothetical protein
VVVTVDGVGVVVVTVGGGGGGGKEILALRPQI